MYLPWVFPDQHGQKKVNKNAKFDQPMILRYAAKLRNKNISASDATSGCRPCLEYNKRKKDTWSKKSKNEGFWDSCVLSRNTGSWNTFERLLFLPITANFYMETFLSFNWCLCLYIYARSHLMRNLSTSGDTWRKRGETFGWKIPCKKGRFK